MLPVDKVGREPEWYVTKRLEAGPLKLVGVQPLHIENNKRHMVFSNGLWYYRDLRDAKPMCHVVVCDGPIYDCDRVLGGGFVLGSVFPVCGQAGARVSTYGELILYFDKRLPYARTYADGY